MKVSLNWLSDYVQLPEVDELARRLTMAGLEVEGIERIGADLAGVVVAQIKESVPHPNADKLSVTKIDAGTGQLLQVVCGAKNYEVGDKVPLATVGTRLPGGQQIQAAKLRGVDSFGMLCSARELGLSEDAAGLLILDPAAKVGQGIAAALGIEDVVLELNVTPNRPDALSHLGIAREIAVLTGQKVKLPASRPAEKGGKAADRVKIRIEDATRCPRYCGRVVEGVTIGPSPAWVQNRLRACGVRAINNVVDVTNYVLLEYGQPLHAFDLDKVGGAEIVVRLARHGERMTTLDGKERPLDPDDLLICDRDKPQVLAGIMGGADSEVTGSTKRVLLECAHFQPATVRRTSKRHALKSESSHRFERGTDVSAVPDVIDRAASLIAELAGGQVLEGRVDVYPKPVLARKVTLRAGRAAKLLGAPVSDQECRTILAALDFVPEDAQGGTSYAVPYRRVDVEREEDLIEEVARIRGYDAIPSTMPRGPSELSPEPIEDQVLARVRSAMSAAGLDEVVNYSFVSPRELAAFGDLPPPVVVQNPLSVEQSVMRTTLYAGLLQNVSRNLRHQVGSIRLYELGRTYRADPQGGRGGQLVAIEDLKLAGVLCGSRQGRTWTAKDAAMDFFDARGAVEYVLSALNIEATFEPCESPHFHPRAAAAVRSGGALLGLLGELHPRIAKRLDVPAGVMLFELDVAALTKAANLVPAYQPIGRYPAVLRDVAFTVGAELRNDQVRAVILEVGRPLLEDAVVFDVYTGEPVPAGKKSMAYALSYRVPDRTLTDAEVNEAHGRIVPEVSRRLQAQLRA